MRTATNAMMAAAIAATMLGCAPKSSGPVVVSKTSFIR